MTPLSNTAGSGSQPAGALTAVQLCFTSYATDPINDISTYLPGWKIVWNGSQSSDGNYAFIAVDPTGDNYGLAIRGSLPPQDIFKSWAAFANWVLEDLDVITRAKWPYASTPNPEISTGANTAFNNVLTMTDTLAAPGKGVSVTDYLTTNVINAGKQLIITGHSLGGNVANVFSSYFVTTVGASSNISLFTFAAPAAGNPDFANDLDSKLSTAWHYQNSNDIVPNFPVSPDIVKVGFLYFPKPEASAITVTYKNHTVSLREAFILLAGVFLLYDYQQQANNYTTFGTDLYPEYDENTAADWFGQAGAQHAVINYANFINASVSKATLAENV